MLERPNAYRNPDSLAGEEPPSERASPVVLQHGLDAPRLPPIARDDQGAVRARGSVLLGGKYRLERLLAVGGMSQVWLGTHMTLGREVAVKFIDVESRDAQQTAQRFLREARLAASVHHPNVINVVDFGIAENGEPVMVMELLDGMALAQRMATEPRLATREVVQIMSQVLGALEAVHRAGILHADMKPANVMLGTMADERDVFAWLIDFGIAFSIDPRSELGRGRCGTDLSRVTGTPEYMAPEQAEGRCDLDERVDVYAASVMLYEMLAGCCPFTDQHPGRVLFKVIDGTHVPLAVLRPDIPELSAVVAAGMSRDRESRPANARELRRLLLDAARPASIDEDASGLHLPVSDPPALARTSPDAHTPTRAERNVAPTHEAALSAASDAMPWWLVAVAYALGLFMVGGAVYGTTRETAPGRMAEGLPHFVPHHTTTETRVVRVRDPGLPAPRPLPAAPPPEPEVLPADLGIVPGQEVLLLHPDEAPLRAQRRGPRAWHRSPATRPRSEAVPPAPVPDEPVLDEPALDEPVLDEPVLEVPMAPTQPEIFEGSGFGSDR